MGQGWLVFELSGSALDLGLLGAAASIPTILVTLFGGVLADRLDKRKVIMATSLVVALLLVVLSTLDFTGVVKVWQVIIIAALIGLVGGLDWPARQSIFPSLIEREQMMSAIALNSVLWQGTRMVMPAIGGVIIALSDTAVIFASSAVGFLIMYAVLKSIDLEHRVVSRGSSMQQFVDGWRFIASTRLFAVLIPLTWVSMFFGTSYLQLMPIFADRLGTGEQGFGLLISASGVGSVLGTILVLPLQKAGRLGWIMLGGLFLSTMTLYGFSLVVVLADTIPGAFFLALFCVMLMAVFSSVFLIASMTVLQLRVPDELRGRVMGVHGITFSLIALGGLFSGVVASAFTPAIAVTAGASIIVIVTGLVVLTQPEVRNLDGRSSG